MGNKYFGTDGVRGRVGEGAITPELVLRLGYAAGRVLLEHAAMPGNERPSVLIGKDTRASGYMLEAALEAGFSAAGVDVCLTGPLPTPAVAYLTRALRLQAGIVISASHNPHDDNGIKFFSARGTKFPDAMEAAIEARMSEPMGCVASAALGRVKRIDDAAGRYIEFCKSTFPLDCDLRGLHLVVDCAHGAAYHIAPHVFHELGAEVSVIGARPDGVNINAGCGATHTEALVAEVLARQADLGIALDGDADRLIMCDRSGQVFDGDQLLYAIICGRLRHGPVTGVAGTLMTNLAFEQAMERLGIPFARAAVGDRHVLALLQAQGWTLGGENSGHILCLDRHSTGDGIISALQVLAAVRETNQSLSALLAPLEMCPQRLINVPLSPGFAWREQPAIMAALAKSEADLAGRGRVLLRASGTEPLLRVMVEGVDASEVDQHAASLAALIRTCLPAR